MGRVIGKPNCCLGSIKLSAILTMFMLNFVTVLFLFYLDDHGEWNCECKCSTVCSLKQRNNSIGKAFQIKLHYPSEERLKSKKIGHRL